jgi:hypothetical protein
MAKTYTLLDLVPEQDTFEDKGDGGKEYPIRQPTEFSTVELAELTRLQRKLFRAQELFAFAEHHPDEASDEEADRKLKGATRLMEEAMTGILQMILPDLPPTRAQAIKLKQKEHFFNWWKDAYNAPQESANPNADAGPSTPMLSSPGLSTSTNLIPSES